MRYEAHRRLGYAFEGRWTTLTAAEAVWLEHFGWPELIDPVRLPAQSCSDRQTVNGCSE